MKKTRFYMKPENKWVIIDAKDQILGKLSTHIAKVLQGKHKATYTPNVFCGDKVVVINAKYVRLTANKPNAKVYQKYSGYPSGRKEMPIKIMLEKDCFGFDALPDKSRIIGSQNCAGRIGEHQVLEVIVLLFKFSQLHTGCSADRFADS